MARRLAVSGWAAFATAAVLLAGCTAARSEAQLAPGSPLRLADRAATGGDYQTSATLYRQAFEANPKSLDALVGLGTQLRRPRTVCPRRAGAAAGKPAQAERHADPARARPRSRSEAGKPQAALASLDAARARAPRDLQVITARGIALDRLSRHAGSPDRPTARVSRSTPPTSRSFSNLGLSLRPVRLRPTEGINILRELIRDSEANLQDPRQPGAGLRPRRP